MATDFSKAQHTIIVSDIHLSDAQPPTPGNPLWKLFKRPKYFVDKKFRRFLEKIKKDVPGQIELILNGDIFDFDSVMVKPEHPSFKMSWLERQRGLNPTEQKSRFKMRVILEDHSIWLESIRDFVMDGHRVVFVLGNHDMELSWPSLQNDVVDMMHLPEEKRSQVRFCEWFYISNKDTLVEHGHQYDDYCCCSNPVHPLIKKGNQVFVRIPFGNLAGKFMLNGMGLMNPHVDSSFIKDSLKEYVQFFMKYVIRVQPFIIWTWLWGAAVTFFVSLSEGFLPSLRDPLTIENRVDEISEKSNASPRTTRSLRALHVHPAIFNPLKIVRELWLDRAIVFALILFGAWQIFTALNIFITPISWWWFLLLFLALMPFLIFYARNVSSEMGKVQKAMARRVPTSSRIAKVQRVCHGHTHLEQHTWVNGIELLNTGTWSPAYRDVECTQPYGNKCFIWIKPAKAAERKSELYKWDENADRFEIIPPITA